VNIKIQPVRLLVNPVNDYTTRLARDTKEVKAAQALRFQVFNLELKGGLEQSYHLIKTEDLF
jgi:putative hemolysin